MSSKKENSAKENKAAQRSSSNQVVTEDTTIAEILSYPNGYEVLLGLGVPCVVCPLVGAEQAMLTIGAVCKAYGLDLEKVLGELNQKLKRV